MHNIDCIEIVIILSLTNYPVTLRKHDYVLKDGPLFTGKNKSHDIVLNGAVLKFVKYLMFLKK